MSTHLTSFFVKNWRGLPEIDIRNLFPAQAFVGANGTGKTSMLWALITFIRALNCRASESNHQNSSEVPITGDDMSKLLCQSSLATGFSESFLPLKFQRSNAKDEKVFLSGVVGGIQYDCSVMMNGVVKIVPPFKNFDGKIRFGFFTGDPVVGIATEEQRQIGDVLSAFSTKMFRRMYSALTPENVNNLHMNLQKLFGVKKVIDDSYVLLIEEESGEQVELIHTGTAFRKAYIIFVLMYYISQSPESKRIFFIEEVEAFLHPSMQTTLMRLILEIADSHNIQLFITSCSSHVLKHFDQTQCFIMTKEKQIIFEPWTSSLITLDLLGINPESIVIMCDGDQDPKFLEKVIELMDLRNILDIIKFYPNTSMGSAIGLLKKHYPKVHVIVICDREFSQEPLEDLCEEQGKELGLKKDDIFFWELPCIESYLVSHHFLVENNSILDWLNLDLGSELWKKYAKCYMGGVKATKSIRAFLYPVWSEAEIAVKKIPDKSYSQEDIFKIVKALKGHELEKDIKFNCNIGRNDMVRALTNRVTTYPGMDILKGLLTDAYKRIYL